VGLTASGTSWLISDFADDLQGTDLLPLINGIAFCLAAFVGQYDSAFALLSDNAKAEIKTAAGLALYYISGTGAKGTLCAPEPSTLKVTGAETQVDMTLSVLSSSGAISTGTMTVFLIQDATNQWKVDGWKFS
jgi:hypothetical protein